MDEIVLLWLNTLAGSSHPLLGAAQVAAQRLPWMIGAVLFIVLWYTDQQEGTGTEEITQQESRQQALFILLAAALAFTAARTAAEIVQRPPPLAVVPLTTPVNAAPALTGSFPASDTAFWFALAAGIAIYRWQAAAATALLGLFWGALHVGLGYVYPSDVIAGMCVGILAMAAIATVQHKLLWLVNPVLLLFAHFPAVAYSLGLLVLLDVTRRLAWFWALLVWFF